MTAAIAATRVLRGAASSNMAGLHTSVSPSSFARVELCPGSVAMAATAPGRKDTVYAAQGTVFHRLIALCLLYGFEPYDFEGLTCKADGFEIEVTDEMIDHLEAGLDYVAVQLPGKLYIEKRVSLDEWLPGQAGTVDIGAFDDEFIYVFDWKYGAGIPVFPKLNRQTMLYALGFWWNIARHKTKATKFKLFIEQPRNPTGGGMWECTLDDLLRFGKRAGQILDRALSPNAPLHAGEKQCQFCPAKGICPEYDRFSTEAMSMKFEDLDGGKEPPKLASKMNLQRRAFVALHAAMLHDWIDEQHKFVLDAALDGDEVPLVKVIEGRRPARKWADKEQAEQELLDRLPRDKVFTRKLISPSQAQKALGKAEYDKLRKPRLIIEGEPKPILVPMDHPGTAFATIQSKFDDLTGEK